MTWGERKEQKNNLRLDIDGFNIFELKIYVVDRDTVAT